jgi:hypothetical protein
MQAEQLIALVGRVVGLIDEFTYENGVDPKFYVACGTKFVVATTRSLFALLPLWNLHVQHPDLSRTIVIQAKQDIVM